MNLHEAIRNGDTETAKRLIEEGVYLSGVIERFNFDDVCTDRFTPAHEAAKKGNIEILEFIKEHDGPINHIPCREVRLRNKRGSKSKPANSGPVGVAVDHDQLKTVKWFEQQDEINFHNLGHGKMVNLWDAIENNAVNVTRYLIRRGFKLYGSDDGYDVPSDLFRFYRYNKGIDAILLLLSKGGVFRIKALPQGEKMYQLSSYILKDPEIFLKCGNTVLENLAGGLNILSACLKEQKEDPKIKEYAEELLPKLVNFIKENDFSFEGLRSKCKTVDDIQELSFQAAKVLEIYECNKSCLSTLSEFHELLLSANPKILEIKKEAKQLEIESIQFNLFKLCFKDDLEQKEVYKGISSLKELFIELLDYFGPQIASCLSDLELFDPKEEDQKEMSVVGKEAEECSET